jgi:hypothetical protein
MEYLPGSVEADQFIHARRRGKLAEGCPKTILAGLIIGYDPGKGRTRTRLKGLLFIHFSQFGIAAVIEIGPWERSQADDYQAILEDISLWSFLAARAGYAMLKCCVSALEPAAEAAVGKS